MPRSDAIPRLRDVALTLGAIYTSHRRLIGPEAFADAKGALQQIRPLPRRGNSLTARAKINVPVVEVPRLPVRITGSRDRATAETIPAIPVRKVAARTQSTPANQSRPQQVDSYDRSVRRMRGVASSWLIPVVSSAPVAAAILPPPAAKPGHLLQVGAALCGAAAFAFLLMPWGWWRQSGLMPSWVRFHHVVSWGVLFTISSAGFVFTLAQGPGWLSILLGIAVADSVVRGWLVFRLFYRCGLLKRGLAFGMVLIAAAYYTASAWGSGAVGLAISWSIIGGLLAGMILLPSPWRVGKWFERRGRRNRRGLIRATRRNAQAKRVDRFFGPDLVEIFVRGLVAHRLQFNACYRCGYSLRGHSQRHGRCPECGSAFVREAMSYRGGPYGVVDWRGRFELKQRSPALDWESVSRQPAITVMGTHVQNVFPESHTHRDRRVYPVKVFPVNRS